ncbi:hypothetical protein ADIARSV_3990 [Arcticibacter svalbardensis MN12-7]|uniref:Uncharacterized protein n=1 Tax=Arcticibacter svalbardensis MN12-7 TaxID=1150600 RepID=R9GM40_9SPHI|nr:hypothetical protein ADIARSV_3990 [Arcticibacter svalbardensis MN12-7]
MLSTAKVVIVAVLKGVQLIYFWIEILMFYVLMRNEEQIFLF